MLTYISQVERIVYAINNNKQFRVIVVTPQPEDMGVNTLPVGTYESDLQAPLIKKSSLLPIPDNLQRRNFNDRNY